MVSTIRHIKEILNLSDCQDLPSKKNPELMNNHWRKGATSVLEKPEKERGKSNGIG
jgi:hypothetical protein